MNSIKPEDKTSLKSTPFKSYFQLESEKGYSLDKIVKSDRPFVSDHCITQPYVVFVYIVFFTILCT